MAVSLGKVFPWNITSKRNKTKQQLMVSDLNLFFQLYLQKKRKLGAVFSVATWSILFGTTIVCKNIFRQIKKIEQSWRRPEDCVKSVQIRGFFWSVFFCIQSEYRKIRTKNNSVFGRFSRSARKLWCVLLYKFFCVCVLFWDFPSIS